MSTRLWLFSVVIGAIVGLASVSLFGAPGGSQQPDYQLFGFRRRIICPTNCTVRTCDYCHPIGLTQSKKCSMATDFCETTPQYNGSSHTQDCGTAKFYLECNDCLCDFANGPQCTYTACGTS